MIPTTPGTVPFEEQDTDDQVDAEMPFEDDILSTLTSAPTPRAQVNENLTFEAFYDACRAAQLHLPPASEGERTSAAGVINLFKDETRIWKLASALWDDVVVEKTSPTGVELTDAQIEAVEAGIRREQCLE